MRDRLSPAAPSRAKDGAVTAGALLATMGLGGVLAVVVLALFGKSARTDAFFAAYGAFAFISSAAQSLRVSLAARLLPEQGWGALDRYLGGVLIAAAVLAVPLLLLGRLSAELLVGNLGDDAVRTAQAALALLWLAGLLQLVSGLSAAALGARGRFPAAALAYVVGGVLSVAAVVALSGSLGVLAVSVGITVGSTLTAALLLRHLLHQGWRPARVPGARAAAGQVALGSLGPVVLQATYVLSLAFAARLGEGSVTLYSYGFFAVMLVVGTTAGPVSIVLAGPLAATWDRSLVSLRPVEASVSRAALLLAAPLVAAGHLLGDEVLRLLLGGVLTPADTHAVAVLVLGLSGMVVAQIVGTVPLVAAFANERYAAVAACAAVAVIVHVPLSMLAVATDNLTLLAVAASGSSLVLAAGLLVVVHGRRAARAGLLVLRDTGTVALLALVAFGGGQLLVVAGGDVWEAPGVLLGVVLYTAGARLLPSWWSVLRPPACQPG